MLDPEKILPDYRGWIWRVAMNIENRDRQRQEDLAQEGYYAMWEALKTFDASKGSLPSYLTRAAERRMRRAQEKDLFLGTPGVRGHTRERPPVPLDTSPDPEAEVAGWVDRQLSAELGELEMAYHHGEIMEAIRDLNPTQRQYVYYRFWHQMTNSEIQQVIGGGNPSGHWTHATRGARARLASKLAHLADAA